MDPYWTLKSGERLHINDHVYVSPPWDTRDGTPYSIARIMEFLPPKETDHVPNKGKGKERWTRVRVAWFYRPGDVTDRQVSDSRLLLAAIFSEVVPITQLRGKCYIRHRDKIADLVAWKKKPDRFYFHRLFDPYIKKEFEVLLSTDVTNLPQRIKDVLCSRYDFIVCEKEVVQELTDAIHLCDTCSEWCANPDTVRCDSCKRFFHMACVQPPLMAKPSRGYGWSCATCARRHEEDVDAHDVRHDTPPVRARGPGRLAKPKKVERINSLADDKESDDRYFKLWPFRYFGQYTVAEDTLDPNDLIFPRAATRVGPRFQATVPNMGEKPSDEIPERGGHATIEILNWVCHMPPEAVNEVERRKSTLTSRRDMQYNVDYLTEVIFRLSQSFISKRPLEYVSLKVPTSLRKWKKAETRYTDREWNDEELRAFALAVQEYGGELRLVREEIPTRTMPEIVRHFGRWKNAQLRLQHRQAQLLELSGSKGRRAHGSESDDEGSVIRFDQESAQPATIFCGSCRTRDSAVWWKAPKGMSSSVLCDVCGLNWRKYGDHGYSRINRDDPLLAKRVVEKREGTPLTATSAKRQKVGPMSGDSTPTPPPYGKQPTCQCCKKPNGPGKVLKCKKCALTVHAATCGAVYDEETAAEWLCDVCQNETTLEASLTFECMLCPRSTSDKQSALNSAANKRDAGFLRSGKPTEGQSWVHTLCSIFNPDVQYADAALLRTVEGVSTIPAQKWSAMCNICGLREGAVIRCAECNVDLHASCGWKTGYKFGFEMQAVKPSKRDVTVVVFRSWSGVLAPYVACAHHNPETKRIFSLCDIGHTGETVLQIYCRTYKQIAAGHSYPLLRKARRLDMLIPQPHHHPKVDVTTVTNAPEQKCAQCGTEHSPMYYPVAEDDGGLQVNGAGTAKPVLCHRCHWPKVHAAMEAGVASMQLVAPAGA